MTSMATFRRVLVHNCDLKERQHSAFSPTFATEFGLAELKANIRLLQQRLKSLN